VCVAVGIGATVGVEWGFDQMFWARFVSWEWVKVVGYWVR
jgi:hypothetical protein